MSRFIPVAVPDLSGNEKKYVNDCLDTTWISSNGSYIKRFEESFAEYFDINTVGRFVIGRFWNTATEAEQEEYIELFKKLIIKNYGSKMSMYTGEGFNVIGTRVESEKATVVSSKITHPGSKQTTNIDWRVGTKDGKMGIIDVIIEGVSMSVTQKQEYASIIQRGGGNIESLLVLMRKQAGTGS